MQRSSRNITLTYLNADGFDENVDGCSTIRDIPKSAIYAWCVFIMKHDQRHHVPVAIGQTSRKRTLMVPSALISMLPGFKSP